MNPAIDFQIVSRPKKQEICTNPLYYAYSDGEALDLILIEADLAKKISISKHTPAYILIKIDSDDINVLPSHPILKERHIRIDRVFAQKGDNRVILSKLHFTWIFANAAGEKVEFRGYYHKNSFDCLQTKGKSKAFVTDEALLNTIHEQAKTEYSLFLEINAKCATEYHKAQSRYEAKSDAMIEPKYLLTVTDEEFAADMKSCEKHFRDFKNLSEDNINNVFELFKTHIHSQLQAQRNSTQKDENSFEEAQEEKVVPATSKAAKKKKAKKSKAEQLDATYDISTLRAKFNEIMANAHKVKNDPVLTLQDFLTYVIEANEEKSSWERAATPVWCALDDTSPDFKKLEIMRNMLDKIPSRITVATQRSDEDNKDKDNKDKDNKDQDTKDQDTKDKDTKDEDPLDPQKIATLFPDHKNFFEKLFEEFLQEDYFRPLKNEADFARRFDITVDEIVKDRKLQYFSREQIILEYVYDVQKIHEQEFIELMLVLFKLYPPRYKSFISSVRSMLLSHKNLDTPQKKNSYQLLINLASNGRSLVLQDLISACIVIEKYKDTANILFGIHEIRKKIKQDNLAAWFSLGEAHTLCLQNINEASGSAYSKIVFNAFYEMWSTMEDHLKTTTPSLNDAYVGTALSFSLYQSMKEAKDKLYKQSSPPKDAADTAQSLPTPPARPLTFTYQTSAATPKENSPEHSSAAESLLALKIDENKTSPNRDMTASSHKDDSSNRCSASRKLSFD